MNPAIFTITEKIKENQPIILKWGLILLLIIVGFFIGIKIYKSLKKDTADDAEDDTDKENLTHPKSWYSQAADSLKAAMDRIGTDEDTIFNILNELKNKDDWNYLVAKFGMYAGFDNFYAEDSLVEWLGYELDESETAKVKAILKKIGVVI